MAPRLSAVCCSEKELKKRLSKSPYSLNVRGHTKSAFSRSNSQTPKKSLPASRTALNKRIFQTIDPSEISLFSSTPSNAATGAASHPKSNQRKGEKHVKRADPSEISLFSSTPSKNAATGAANQEKSSPSKDVQEKSGPASEFAPLAETVSVVKRKRGRPRIHPRIDPDQATSPVKRPRGRPRKYSAVSEEEEEIDVATVIEEQEELRSVDDVVFRQSDFLSKYKSAFVINNGEADTEACWDVPVGECVDQAVMEMECGRDPLEDIDDFDHIFEDVLEYL